MAPLLLNTSSSYARGLVELVMELLQVLKIWSSPRKVKQKPPELGQSIIPKKLGVGGVLDIYAGGIEFNHTAKCFRRCALHYLYQPRKSS
jgi:hypothetical protein